MKLELPNANPIAFEHSLHFLVQILVLSARASYLFRSQQHSYYYNLDVSSINYCITQ